MKKSIENTALLAHAVASRLTMQAGEFLTWRRVSSLDTYRANEADVVIGPAGRTWTARFADGTEIVGCPTVSAAQTAASVLAHMEAL